MTDRAPSSIEHLLRDLAPQVLGALARRGEDFSSAEDAVQEALIAAAAQWPRDGVPENPRGWVFQVARRRLADLARSDIARRRREDAAATERFDDAAHAAPDDEGTSGQEDDTLVLLFMCCHPSLSPSSAIALTLRAVGGLTTSEIASAFFVPEATMAQRISRAKQSIKSSSLAFAMPTDAERNERLNAVLHVLYLIFNEGYASSGGPALQRTDLSNEAIRLTRAMHQLLPRSGEVAGLLALMLLTDARRSARSGPNGELIPLDEQDRSLWDQPQIREGIALVSAVLSAGAVGPYQLQAAVAAVHSEAGTAAETDWPQILALYDVLRRMSRNPMVELSRAIATAMVHGPTAGLSLVEALDTDPHLRGHYRLDAVRGHLYAMTGDIERAVSYFQAAALRTASIPERDYLNTKAARLRTGRGDRPEPHSSD